MSGVQSIERAFALLRALAVGPAGVTDLSERTELPNGPAIIATGPLTSPSFHRALEALLDHPRVVAVGEAWLYYHYMNSPREDQIAALEWQLDLALEAGRPVVDIAFFPEDSLALDELARARGVTAIVDCGVMPGMGNAFAGRVYLIDTGMLTSVYQGQPAALEIVGDRETAIAQAFPEQAAHHARLRKPGLQFLLRDVVTVLAQLLAVIRNVPGLEFVPGQFLQLRDVASRKLDAAIGKILEK